MSPIYKKPAGDENDSYLKPGQADVDDLMPHKKPVTGGPMPKFKMPEGKGSRVSDKTKARNAAIAKRLGK